MRVRLSVSTGVRELSVIAVLQVHFLFRTSFLWSSSACLSSTWNWLLDSMHLLDQSLYGVYVHFSKVFESCRVLLDISVTAALFVFKLAIYLCMIFWHLD